MRSILETWIDKKEGFSSLSFFNQVIYLAYFRVKITGDEGFVPKEIDSDFTLIGLPKPKNIPDIFSKLKGKVFLEKNNYYILNRDILKKLELEFSQTTSKTIVAKNLHTLLGKIKNENAKNFLEEAIVCYESHAYRASIIMTWILVINTLQDYVFQNKLKDFNDALKKQKFKINEIKTKDDFLELKENELILVCRSSSIITGDIQKILNDKLGIRNTCGHPNGILIKETKATDFIDDLVENVIIKYV